MGVCELEDIARQWVDYFNNRDIDRLLDLYHDTASHYSPKLLLQKPETLGIIHGKEALRAWWLPVFQRLNPLRYDLTSVTANKDRVFIEYVRCAFREKDLSVAEVFLVKEGKIVESRVYHG